MSDGLCIDIIVQLGGSHAPCIRGRFEVSPGISALFGPSGSGKTTMMLAIAGLLRPSEGRVTLERRVLFDANVGVDVPPERRRVALVFQSLALFPHMTALANVAYALPRELGRAERTERARTWLSRMRVAHLGERMPRTFSGGEGQRVALARALASEPSALLLDEPFSALDEELRLELGRELSAILEERPIPALLVTHDRADARRLAERVFTLEGEDVPL